MLDSYDLKILAVLQRHGDIGLGEMAQQVNLSASQCSRRIARLRKDGHVTAVRAILNPGKVGVGIFAYVLLTMRDHSPQSVETFHSKIRQLDEVLECQKLTGTADIILKVATSDLASFNALLTEHVLGAPEVATAQSSIILENIKSTTVLPLPCG